MAYGLIVSEALNGNHDPREGSATYFYALMEDAEKNFEPWYVDENYYCVDANGNVFRFVLNEDGMLHLIRTSNSERDRDIFERMMRGWIEHRMVKALQNQALASLIARTLAMSEVLSDREIVKYLAE